MNAERTAVELADDAFAAPDPGFGARLAAIRARAAGDGVSVLVDLHGALVDLRFDRWALNRSPGELAGLVRRLAEEAAGDALRQGRELLGDLLPADASPHRADGPQIRPRPVEPQEWSEGPEIRPRRRAEPQVWAGPKIRPSEPGDDSFTPATWAT
ncbi:hypothetical protein ACIA5G_11415 [Amycolatopsis sp. NPDC051758]|uniref:hypothetical protein n=1 Tax=Amycolatopsis sp. NPDC051758 TaxID=3363935 RepID=UPI0037938D6C